MGVEQAPWLGILENRYTFVSFAGSGATSAVYQAEDKQSGRQVAIKVLLDPQQSERFQQECELLSSLESGYIQEFFQFGNLPDGRPFMALQWLEGLTLADWLSENTLEPARATKLIIEVARGLKDLHQHDIVHCDIKPSNIFICTDGPEPVARLIDLGVACQIGEMRSGMIGTPPYMAPELLAERHFPTAASDIYSLCAVFYELVTGRKIFKTNHLPALLGQILHGPIISPRAYNPELSLDLEQIMIKGLSRDPDDRYCHGGLLLESLTGSNTDAHTSSPPLESPLHFTGNPRPVTLLFLKQRTVPHGEHTALVDARLQNEISDIIQRHNGEFHVLPDSSLIGIFGTEKTLGDEVYHALASGLEIQTRYYLDASVVMGKLEDEESLAPSLKLAESLLKRPGTTSGVRADGNVVRRARGDFMVVREKGFSVIAGIADWHERLKQPLFGREPELEDLEDGIRRIVKTGRASAIAVIGEDGLGKSSLLARVLPISGDLGIRLVTAVAHSDEQSRPYALIRSLLLHRAGISSNHGQAARKAQLDRFLDLHGKHARALKRLAEGDSNAADSLDMEAQRWSFWEAVASVVEADLQHGPVLWMVDDINYADNMSRNLIRWLVRSMVGPIGLICSMPPHWWQELAPQLPKDMPIKIIQLSQLPEEAASHLLAEALPGTTREERKAVLHRGGGNPMFLEELAQLTRSGAGERALTRNLQMNAQAALDQLSEDCAAFARAASVIGDRGPSNLLKQILPEFDFDTARSKLETIGIWFDSTSESRDTFRFKHSLMREAIYQLLSQEKREHLHHTAALYYDTLQKRDPLHAARHYLKANQNQDAARCLLDSAAAAHQAADSETTLKMLKRLQKVTGTLRGEALYLRASSQTWLGHLPLALDDIQELLTEDDLPAELQARAACLGCHLMRRLSDPEEGLRLVEQAIAAAMLVGDAYHIARCYFHAAFTYYDVGDETGVHACFEAVSKMSGGDIRIRAIQADIESLEAMLHNHYERAVNAAQRSLELNHATGNLSRIGANVANIGLALMHLGRYHEALPYLTMARSIYTRQGNRLQRYDATFNEGRLLGLLERYDEALPLLEEALNGLSKAGEKHFHGVVNAVKAQLLAYRNQAGDLDQAVAIIDAGMNPESQSVIHRMEYLLAAMKVFYHGDLFERALHFAEQAVAMLQWHGNKNEYACEAICYAALIYQKTHHSTREEIREQAEQALDALLATCTEPVNQKGIREGVLVYRLFRGIE